MNRSQTALLHAKEPQDSAFCASPVLPTTQLAENRLEAVREAVDAILAPFAEDPLTGTDGTVAESPSPDTTGNQNSAAPTTGDAAPEQPEAAASPKGRRQQHVRLVMALLRCTSCRKPFAEHMADQAA